MLRQWSTLHPEFAFLPRKFKIAVTGARKTAPPPTGTTSASRCAATPQGEVGFRVAVGGGMGRTPLVATEFQAFVPWQQILVYIEAVVRVYNLYGRRDNHVQVAHQDPGQGRRPALRGRREARVCCPAGRPRPRCWCRPNWPAWPPASPCTAASAPRCRRRWRPKPLPAFGRWLQRNVHAHRLPGYRAVTLSLKRAGLPPGDVTADQMDAAADLAERFSRGELRVTHDQNLLLPWVRESELRALWLAAREAGFASPNIGLLTDMIACPGGDLCALANARSIPIAAPSPSALTTWTNCTTSATSTCTSAAASTAAATTTAATSACWASTRTAWSGTRSAWPAPTAARSAARPCRARSSGRPLPPTRCPT
jgi:sulfite reductase (NADPH) hemoprotein beta-component